MRCAILLALLLTGCAVGPNFQRPVAPSAGGYGSGADAVRPVAGAPGVTLGEGPSERWWEAFGSAEMNALVDRAIANNQSLAASNATLERAQAMVSAAAGRRLPQVDASARVERQEANLAAFGFEPSRFPGFASGNPVFNLYSLGGGVSFDPDLFGGKSRAVEQAGARAEAQMRQTEAAHLTVAGRVVTQVLTIAAIRARIATATALLDEDQRNVDLTEARRKAGDGTLVEVLNAQSQLANDRADLPQLAQLLDEARHMLAVLIGTTPAELGATDFEIAAFRLPADVPVTLPSELVHRRPDILQAEAELHAATAQVGIATARLYPSLTLGGSYSQGAPRPGDLFDSAFRGFDIFAGLTAPIFDGGTRRAEKRGAEAEARAAAATYKQTVLEAFGQVADLLDAVQSDQQSVRNRMEAVNVAARSRDLSRRSFKVGNSGILQVLDAERLYQRARSGLIDAQARQYLNVARLYVATAGGAAPIR